jgi:hypothetical protein
MPKNDHLLTAAEAADRVGMRLRTFQRHVALGNIEHAHKLPGLRGAYLFDADTIDAFVAQKEAS